MEWGFHIFKAKPRWFFGSSQKVLASRNSRGSSMGPTPPWRCLFSCKKIGFQMEDLGFLWWFFLSLYHLYSFVISSIFFNGLFFQLHGKFSSGKQPLLLLSSQSRDVTGCHGTQKCRRMTCLQDPTPRLRPANFLDLWGPWWPTDDHNGWVGKSWGKHGDLLTSTIGIYHGDFINKNIDGIFDGFFSWWFHQEIKSEWGWGYSISMYFTN